MPGSEKVQPARQSSRIQGGQDSVERHGGLDVVMEKIVQWEQENRPSNGRGMIDRFRLRGSRPWRHMGGHLTNGGWRVEVAHEVARPFNNPNAPLSEGEGPRRCGPGCARESALDAGWHGCPKSAAVTRRAAWRQGVPASHGASRRRTGGGGSGGSDPGFYAAGAAPGRGRWCTPKSTTTPPLFGVAPSTVVPGGKAIERCRGQGGSTDRSGPRLPPAR